MLTVTTQGSQGLWVSQRGKQYFLESFIFLMGSAPECLQLCWNGLREPYVFGPWSSNWVKNRCWFEACIKWTHATPFFVVLFVSLAWTLMTQTFILKCLNSYLCHLIQSLGKPTIACISLFFEIFTHYGVMTGTHSVILSTISLM